MRNSHFVACFSFPLGNVESLEYLIYTIMKRILTVFAASILVALTLHTTATAQSFPGRLAFGFDAEGNKYWGNFTDNQFWFSGDAFFRYNIMDWLSFHLAVNGGQLRIKVNEQNIRSHKE